MIKIGDFMCIEGTGFVSKVIKDESHPSLANDGENLIELNTGVKVEEFEPTHVQVVTNVDPNRKVGDKSGVEVISCDPNGVWCRDVRTEEWDKKWRFMTLKLGHEFNQEELKHALKFLYSTIGSIYDFAGLVDFKLNADLQNRNRWFCSEHVFMFYWVAKRPLQERLKSAFVTPRDCYISSIVTIEEKGGEV